MTGLTHLQRLEAESIHILREVVAETERPVMLYSVGKDSAVMLHLAKKAFFPARPPFPLLHVDTTWKFQAMYELRNRAAEAAGMDLIGIFHSHPDCDAYFSKTDLENSCPWYSFVVLSIKNGKFDHANSFLPNADQTAADKEDLTWPKS